MNASKLAVGSTPIVSGTVGRLLFQGTGNVLGQSQWLFYDAANIRLGVATSTPLYTLDVAGNIHGSTIFADYNIVSTSGNVWLSDGYAIGDYGTGNNRIEFYNNRISLFGNGNEALRIVGATRNLLIGTTTDAGFRLDVNGTARVQGDTTITKTGSALTVAFSSQTAQNSFFTVLNGTDGLQFTSRGSGATGNMGLPANSAEILCFNKSALGLILHTTAYLAIGTHTNERMRLVGSTGNVLINTTTDDGFRLDVNGTARVQGALTTTGAINASGNLIGRTDWNQGFFAYGGGTGELRFVNGTGAGFFYTWYQNNAERMRLSANNNLLINTTTDAGYKLDVNGTARLNGNVDFANNNRISVIGGASSKLGLRNNGGSGWKGFLFVNNVAGTIAGNELLTVSAQGNGFRNTLYVGESFNIDTNEPNTNTSAVLQADSTTKGFLPPRMTNAQRAAIASPAVGLIVYCTDSTEGLYVYKSTGWTFMV
jgi:hypothetical protein